MNSNLIVDIFSTGGFPGSSVDKESFCNAGDSGRCEFNPWVGKIAWRNINNLRYANDTTLRAESKEELKNLLMKVKEKSEKASLKFNTQKIKIMASGPITSWEIDGETVETVTDFLYFWAPKSLQMVIAVMKLKDAYSLEGKL